MCCNPWGCWVRHDLNMKSNKNWFLKFQCSLQKITYVVCICGLNYTVIGQHWSRPGARKIWPVDKIQPSTFFFFFEWESETSPLFLNFITLMSLYLLYFPFLSVLSYFLRNWSGESRTGSAFLLRRHSALEGQVGIRNTSHTCVLKFF